MATDEILVESDSQVFFNSFVDDDDAFINDGTVVATLFESDGTTQVTGVSFPLTLSYVAASDGNYQGTMGRAVNVTKGVNYRMKYTATSGAFQRVRWNDVIARRDVA